MDFENLIKIYGFFVPVFSISLYAFGEQPVFSLKHFPKWLI